MEPVEVLVCLPARLDEGQPAVRDALRPFAGRVRLTWAEYLDTPAVRALRGGPDPERARPLAPRASAAFRAALGRSEVVLAIDLPFDVHRLAPRLRWVQSAGAGVAQLQRVGLERLGCRLTSAAGLAADSIAEFTLARILAHFKRFDELAAAQRERRWQPLPGRSLAGATLGVVGLGAIGRALARRAAALGMRVLAARRAPFRDPTPPEVAACHPLARLGEMLGQCDALVLAAAEGPETWGLMDRAAFAALPPGAFFCNVARGSLVDEAALCDALQTGHLGGAAIDVAAVEPLPAEHPLWRAPRLAISAHCAADLGDYWRDLWSLFAENLRRYLAGEPLFNERPNRL
ncbi:MAG: hypothetical protein KatS3mg124_0655 [Porticoccaceae bacterium]|nr:MAG: hypothetical protein KatS3mg124_0655 [Porticoccaceae bacterium]